MTLQLQQLEKHFGDNVAVNIDQLTIEDGELVGLVGNNGAGKTTLFRLCLDLLKADGGQVLIDGINPAQSEEWKMFTGAYLDEGFLIDFLTPEEYLEFLAKVCDIDKDEVMERTKTIFGHFLNDEILGKKKLIRDFSAGNKQKIGIIAAMIHEPKLLILDEPFNFLDPSSQIALKRILVDFNQQTGATVIISSHNLQHTIDISQRVLLMEHGVIVKDLPNQEGSAAKELEDYFEVAE